MSGTSYLNTAQNVNLEYNLASLGTRIGAFLIDSLIKIGYIFFIAYLSSVSGMIDNYWLMSFFYLPIMFYTLLFEVFREGQTPGKKSQNIKVVSADGTPVSIGQYLLRWLLNLVDLYTLYGAVAMISIGISKKSQRVGDMVANTLVVNTKERKRLEDTGYLDIDESYTPSYPSVSQLSYEDIRIIKEVLKNDAPNAFTLIAQTANKIETIIGVQKTESSKQFLNRVIADFNYYEKVG